jgi:hypothetical protein
LPGITDIRGDVEQTRSAFYDLYKRDAAAAVDALSDIKLGFPALYILRPEISKLGLEAYLSPRNKDALRLSKEIVSDGRYAFEARPEHLPVLNWMFTTGCRETDLGGEYDRIIDAAAILLVKVFGDKSCLGALVDLIFLRHRKGLYTYDAEWALFESGDAGCLSMAAERLLSKDSRDVALARRLLRFLPCCDDTEDPAMQRRHINNWLSVNKPYMYYTGETNLMCSDPCRFRVSDESKYLQKSFGGDSALSQDEWLQLEKLSDLDEDTKRRLGEYSHSLYRNNRQRWQRWMRSPLPDQIAMLKHTAGKRGRYDHS